jgi:hypothetical protein
MTSVPRHIAIPGRRLRIDGHWMKISPEWWPCEYARERSFDARRRFSLESASSGATDRRRPFQMEGGARAWNKKCGKSADANSLGVCSSTASKLAGSARVGRTALSELAANWINAQIGQ